MVAKRRWGAAQPTVKIDLQTLVLRTVNGRPVYSSGTRAIQNVPTDDDEISWGDWTRGIGLDFFLSYEFLCHVPGKLLPVPDRTTLTTSASANPLRWAFEAQDSASTWYLFVVSPQSVVKIELAATPVVRTLRGPAHADAVFASADRLGQPEYLYSARAGGYRWMVPCNNGTRLAVLDTIGVAAAADTWTVANIDKAGTSEDGAAHFEQMASGKVWRATKDGGVSGVARISVLAAGADAEIVGNWGEGFPMDSEGFRIFGITKYDEGAIIHKQDGHYALVEMSDGTLQARNLLEDQPFAEMAAIGSESIVKGWVWHGKVFLPTPPQLWITDLFSAIPCGPESIDENTDDDPNISGGVRYGTIPSGAGIGRWVYAPFNTIGGGGEDPQGFTLLYGQESRGRTNYPLIWYPLFIVATGKCQLVHVQRNGVLTPPTLFYGSSANGNDVSYMRLDKAGGPAATGATYGATAPTARMYLNDVMFPSRVALREMEYVIEDLAVTTWNWSLEQQLNGGNDAGGDWTAPAAIGSAITVTGSIFWTAGTNDVCRQWRGIIKRLANAATATPPRLRRATLHFTYLPDVSDEIMFVVDVAATAKRLHANEASIRDLLREQRFETTLAWVDVRGTAGRVVVTDVTDGAPKEMASLQGPDSITVRVRLMEYT